MVTDAQMEDGNPISMNFSVGLSSCLKWNVTRGRWLQSHVFICFICFFSYVFFFAPIHYVFLVWPTMFK